MYLLCIIPVLNDKNIAVIWKLSPAKLHVSISYLLSNLYFIEHLPVYSTLGVLSHISTTCNVDLYFNIVILCRNPHWCLQLAVDTGIECWRSKISLRMRQLGKTKIGCNYCWIPYWVMFWLPQSQENMKISFRKRERMEKQWENWQVNTSEKIKARLGVRKQRGRERERRKYISFFNFPSAHVLQ